MKKKNSLIFHIWKYFLIFSILILAFLWTFQVIFFDKYYELNKINDAKTVASTINNNKNSKELQNIINKESLEKEVCIEISDDGGLPIYSSTYRGKGCLIGNINSYLYKSDFINSNKNQQTYKINNPNFDNNTYVYAIKLENNSYVFINTSIEPVESTVGILRNQLIIITILVLVLSLIISYYISKYISKPIININNKAKRLNKKDTNFISNTNIEEIKELEETLNTAKNELQKTEELRRDLMANVSHDLKTPLTMIKAYAEMSLDLHKDNIEKQKEDINTIVDETERLTILVNDILTLSKMQNNIEKLELEEIDLVDLINSIINKYKYLEELEDYKFKLVCKNKKITIKADKKKLEQVIYNLINNAINYTGKDNLVTIKIINNKENVKVEITDTGKGIKEEDIPFIWDKYYKNKKKHKRNLIGTGLGLSIVKEILEAHNFKYGVDSIIDKGTIFYFYIKKDS